MGKKEALTIAEKQKTKLLNEGIYILGVFWTFLVHV